MVSSDGYVLDALSIAKSRGAARACRWSRDGRVQFAIPLEVGGRLDDISLDAALRLLAVTPDVLGSRHPVSAER